VAGSGEHRSAGDLRGRPHPRGEATHDGIYRVGDVLRSCALTGQHCGADLSPMGNWPGGTPALPSIVTDSP
jgi:hypothetical protein